MRLIDGRVWLPRSDLAFVRAMIWNAHGIRVPALRRGAFMRDLLCGGWPGVGRAECPWTAIRSEIAALAHVDGEHVLAELIKAGVVL